MNRSETVTGIEKLIAECKALQARLEQVHSGDGGEVNLDTAEVCAQCVDDASACLEQARNILVELYDDDEIDDFGEDLDEIEGD